VNGLNRLSGGIMLRRFLWTVFCSIILVGKIHAQEVIVAREKPPELPVQTPKPAEQLASESPTPAPGKSKPREKKPANATLTLEEMRAAGARAAEGSSERSGSQSTKAHEPEVEGAPLPNPTVAENPRPMKRETPVEQGSSPRPSRSRGTKIEGMGPIRPTMMESGREAPSPSP
jgi:cell division septation protein DedD